MEHLDEALSSLGHVEVTTEKAKKQLRKVKAAIRRAKKVDAFTSHMTNHWTKYAAGTAGAAALAGAGYYAYNHWDVLKNPKIIWDKLDWGSILQYIPFLSEEDKVTVAKESLETSNAARQEAEKQAANGDKEGAVNMLRVAVQEVGKAVAAAEQTQNEQVKQEALEARRKALTPVHISPNEGKLLTEEEQEHEPQQDQGFLRRVWGALTQATSDMTGNISGQKRRRAQPHKQRSLALRRAPPRDPQTGRFIKTRHVRR